MNSTANTITQRETNCYIRSIETITILHGSDNAQDLGHVPVPFFDNLLENLRVGDEEEGGKTSRGRADHPKESAHF